MQDVTGRRVHTTETSLSILEAIGAHEGLGLAAIADELDISKSTAHGHVATLQSKEYVVKRGDTYRLGLKLFNLGERAKTRDPRYRLVEGKIREFSVDSTEELDFSVEENGRTIVLFDEIGSRTGPGFQIGDYFYMNTNAAGKAILAEFSDEAVDRVIDYWGLPGETEHTITSRDRLFAELETVRAQGYAINDQENFEGIRAIGRRVVDPTAGVLGAVAISGPNYRLSIGDLHDLAPTLEAYIDEIESELADLDATDAPLPGPD